MRNGKMRKRTILRIILLSLLAAALLAVFVVEYIKYRESQIPEQVPAVTTDENGEESTQGDSETESSTDGKFNYSTAEKSEGLEYALNEDGESYTVVGMGSCTDKFVVLPESYEGKPVTAIGDRAFADAGLDAIAFSTTVKSVGNKAFAGHSNLKIYFEGKSEDWLRGVKKDPGWRIDCDFSVIYPTDPSWEVDITG